MRETRNIVLIVMVFGFFGYAFWAVLMNRADDPLHLWSHRGASIVGFLLTCIGLIWALRFEDKMPDSLADYTGGVYYEQNGLCFMPVMRRSGEQAFLHVYFENRFENDCNAIVHLRPPADSILHHPDAADIHFAFTCPGGGVGVLEQPIAVHPQLQGQVVEVKMAAAVNYPHSHGDQLRSHKGMPCGTLNVDWGETFRASRHELGGEVELVNPVTIHLPIPQNVSNVIRRGQQWTQKIFSRYEK